MDKTDRRIPVYKEIETTVPNRLHMFTTRALFNVEDMTGGAGISIDTGCKMRITLVNDALAHKAPNQCLNYFCLLLKELFFFSGYLEIEYERPFHTHCGYGTTVSQISALCMAVNYLFGKPLSDAVLRKFIMDHYCEEENGRLTRGLDTGVGTVCSFYGGLNFVANKRSFSHLEIPEDFLVLTYIPAHEKFQRKVSLQEEIFCSEKSYQADEEILEIKNEILYNQFLPALLREDWQELGRVTAELHEMGLKKLECERYDYEYEIRLLNVLLENGALVTGMSSLGPLNYSLVDKMKADWIEAYLIQNGYTYHVEKFPVSSKGIYVLRTES